MNCSICIATYNGGQFIYKQLQSILVQINSDDEIIIVDDCSSDNTLDIINSFCDNRIRIFLNERNLGHVGSFSRALSLASMNIIFMSDQDDIWVENRYLLMKNKLLEKDVLLVSSNSSFINMTGDKLDMNLLSVNEIQSHSYCLNNFNIFTGSAGYYGCCMVLKKELNSIILPIPSYVESHDLWIAMAANIKKSNLHLNDITLLRRIHNSNASVVERRLRERLYSRYIFIKSYLHLKLRNFLIKM